MQLRYPGSRLPSASKQRKFNKKQRSCPATFRQFWRARLFLRKSLHVYTGEPTLPANTRRQPGEEMLRPYFLCGKGLPVYRVDDATCFVIGRKTAHTW